MLTINQFNTIYRGIIAFSNMYQSPVSPKVLLIIRKLHLQIIYRFSNMWVNVDWISIMIKFSETYAEITYLD